MGFKEKDMVLVPGTVKCEIAGIVEVELNGEVGGSRGFFEAGTLMHDEDLLKQYQNEYRTKLEVKTNELNDVDAALKEVPGSSRVEKLLGALAILRGHKVSFQNSMMLENGQIIYGEHLALMAVRNTIKELDDLKRDFQQGLNEEQFKVKKNMIEAIERLFHVGGE
jgi:hypothetical protein